MAIDMAAAGASVAGNIVNSLVTWYGIKQQGVENARTRALQEKWAEKDSRFQEKSLKANMAISTAGLDFQKERFEEDKKESKKAWKFKEKESERTWADLGRERNYNKISSFFDGMGGLMNSSQNLKSNMVNLWRAA